MYPPQLPQASPLQIIGDRERIADLVVDKLMRRLEPLLRQETEEEGGGHDA